MKEALARLRRDRDAPILERLFELPKLGSDRQERDVTQPTRTHPISSVSCCGVAQENRWNSGSIGASRRMSILIASSPDGADLDPPTHMTGTVVVNAANKSRQHGDISLCPWISTGPITAGA
jgi:hypothetical protein